MKTVIAIKDCINAFSINSTNPHKDKYSAVLISKSDIFEGEELEVVREGYYRETFDPDFPKDFDDYYCFEVKCYGGHNAIIKSEVFGLTYPKKPSPSKSIVTSARIDASFNNN